MVINYYDFLGLVIITFLYRRGNIFRKYYIQFTFSNIFWNYLNSFRLYLTIYI